MLTSRVSVDGTLDARSDRWSFFGVEKAVLCFSGASFLGVGGMSVLVGGSSDTEDAIFGFFDGCSGNGSGALLFSDFGVSRLARPLEDVRGAFSGTGRAFFCFSRSFTSIS